MPDAYRYTARTIDGDVVRGTLSASGPEAILAALRSRALYVTAVNREAEPFGLVSLGRMHGGPSRRALLTFFRSFSTLIGAAVPIGRALHVAIERCTDTALREALRGVLADVEHGASLSEAMSRRPQVFPALYTAMIRAGETGGILDDVLDRLAFFLERDADLRKRVRSALAYPAVVLSAAIVLVLFLMARIVPMFAVMFESFHADLPWNTLLLLRLGQTLHDPLPWAVATAAAAAGAFGFRRYAASDAGALVVERVRLRLPVVGPLIRKSVVARISRLLATLLRSGVELVAALDVAAPAAGSTVYAHALRDVNAALRAGESLSAPLASTHAFDPMFLTLVRVGEETGLLDAMLLKIAAYYDTDVESAVATLSAVIEPLLIVCLGAAVGFIVFSIFIPLYSLIGSISK